MRLMWYYPVSLHREAADIEGENTMAIPQLSAEERQAALEKAKAARIKRAQVRDDLKSGKLSL